MAESVQAIPTYIDPAALSRRYAWRPTASEWIRHSLLFVLTVATTTLAGVLGAVDSRELEVAMPDPAKLTDYFFYVPEYYVKCVAQLIGYAIHHPAIILQGLSFSAALLAILLAHVMGHYIACRRYGVFATLPFFIPAPPCLWLTFGASSRSSRRSLPGARCSISAWPGRWPGSQWHCQWRWRASCFCSRRQLFRITPSPITTRCYFVCWPAFSGSDSTTQSRILFTWLPGWGY
jgi:hypothetical protein